jgi:hypothetical protein
MMGSGAKARLRLRHDPARMCALLASLRAPRGTVAVLERPHARSTNGTSAAFQSGCGLGLWWGLLTAQGFTVRLVLPRAWKATYNLVVRTGCRTLACGLLAHAHANPCRVAFAR